MANSQETDSHDESVYELLNFCQFGSFLPDETLKLISHHPGVNFRIRKGKCAQVYATSPLFTHLKQQNFQQTHSTNNNTLVDLPDNIPICQSNYSHDVMPLPMISTSQQPIIHQSQTLTLGRQENNHSEINTNSKNLNGENTPKNIPDSVPNKTENKIQNGNSPKNNTPNENKCSRPWSSLFVNIKPVNKQPHNGTNIQQNTEFDKIDAIDKGRRLYTYLTTPPVAKLPPTPRGLVNRGNLCYIHAALQALVSCHEFSALIHSFEPFPSLSTKPSATPVFDSLILFLHDFAAISKKVYVTTTKPSPQKPVYHSPTSIEPNNIYDMVKRLRPPNLSLRRQEDSEEFLGFILQKLHEEMSYVIEVYKNDANIHTPDEMIESSEQDEWLEVGKRNKTASTRRNFIDTSPISQIFCGEMRSSIQLTKTKDSVTHQPFFSLQLDIQDDEVKTVQQALTSMFRLEEVTGYMDASSQETTVNRRQTLSILPSILILQIKRFAYLDDACYKISKQVDYSSKLNIPVSMLSPEFRDKGPITYHLFAVIFHHGESATGGHYTCALFCDSTQQWILSDDKDIYPLSDKLVMQHESKRTAYLLFYRRS